MFFRLVAATSLAVLTLSLPVAAQPESRITGIVRDATGAGIPGVTVTVTSNATKETRTTTTGNDGSYSINVQPGSYAVTAAVPGFRRTTLEVEVPSGGSKPLDFSLETQLTEEVTVTASKREQTILEVPFSVAAPTEETLRMRGVQDIAASSHTIPSCLLTISSMFALAFGATTGTLRSSSTICSTNWPCCRSIRSAARAHALAS